MKLSLKRPLALALGLPCLSGMLGTTQLAGSLDVFQDDVRQTVATHKKAAALKAQSPKLATSPKTPPAGGGGDWEISYPQHLSSTYIQKATL